MSLTLRDLELAQNVVEDLAARGARDQAAAIKRLISTAAFTLSTERKVEPRELLTTGQAARALGVSVQTIKNWANAGQLQTVRLGGRVMVHRDALLRYLDLIRRGRPTSESHPELESKASIEQREFVSAGFPPGKIERVRALSDKIEAGKALTDDEETELAHLESEFARISRVRLTEWIQRQRKSTEEASTGNDAGH